MIVAFLFFSVCLVLGVRLLHGAVFPQSRWRRLAMGGEDDSFDSQTILRRLFGERGALRFAAVLGAACVLVGLGGIVACVVVVLRA